MNFPRVPFNTKLKALKNDGHLCELRTGMLALLLQHNKALKIIAGEENMITVPLF